ncbi:hypothetical protein ACFO1B_29095 [Dactylosporangium siamense]|uniref:hypothetical protein n=1 Tax=Dactylosporangium siamense TaxID=685454 RepID=UPI0019433A1F|nr:hypothetical protein [Dactylosporangium siamense]
MGAAAEQAPVRQRRGWLAGITGALTLGALGAALGGWLAWGTAPDLPDDRAAIALVQPLVPASRLSVDRRHDPAFGYDPPEGAAALLFGGDDYNGGYVAFRVDPPSQNLTGALGIARQALIDGNWTVSTRPADLAGQLDGVVAVRGDLVVQAYQEGASGLVLEIGRREPAPVGPMVALGALAGLALGWLGMRRAVEGTPLTVVLAWAGAGFLAPCTLLTFPITAMMYAAPATGTVASWDIYTAFGFRFLANLGILLLLAATVTALIERRRHLPR